jgi:hypothetical protein
MSVPTFTLNSGLEIPALGFGVFQLPQPTRGVSMTFSESAKIQYRSARRTKP